MRHDERAIRNVDDEIYRVAPKTHSRGRERIDAREEYGRDLREKDYLRAQMNHLANGGQPMPMAAPPMPMDPAMMAPPPMLPAPAPEQQVQMTEDTAAQQGEALGQEYLDEMMTGIDTADSTEELIDAMRGDDRTLQERYDELANFVGERDASATPESVLTLVQPTIMMTEQGAMDSGIGELMQGIAGEVEMETDMGAPTPMGQGIGELMVSQSVEEVVPEMKRGGPVQYYATGSPFGVQDVSQNVLSQYMNLGAPATEDQFSEMVQARLPVYQQLLGDTDQTKRDLQSSLYMDIAQAGLNLASGVDPRTGQSMAGRPLASQFAAAAQPVAARAGQSAREMRNVERAAAAGALQSAERSEAARITAERGRLADLLQGAIGAAGAEQELAGQKSLTVLRAGIEKGLQESEHAFRERVVAAQIDNDQFLQSADATAAMARLKADAGYRDKFLDKDLEFKRGIFDDEQALTELLNTTNNAEERQQLEMTIEAKRAAYEYEGALQQSLQQDRLDSVLTLKGLDHTNAIIMQNVAIAENARQFDVDQTRLVDQFLRQLGLDRTALESIDRYRRFQSNEAKRHRLATVGGEGTGFFQKGILSYTPLTFLPVLNDIGEDSALRQNQEAMDNLNIAKRSAQELAIEQFDHLKMVREAQNVMAQQAQFANQQFQQQELDREDFEAMMGAIKDSQRDLSSVFGNSYQGIMQGLLTDQSLLDAYGNGTLDADTTNIVDRALIELTTPVQEYDPRTGRTSTRVQQLPRAVEEATRRREAGGYAAPIATSNPGTGPLVTGDYVQDFLQGGRDTRSGLATPGDPASLGIGGSGQGIANPYGSWIPGLQAGGDAGWAAFRARTNSPSSSSLEPDPTEGLIVDEMVDVEQATGLLSGPKRALNTVTESYRDVFGRGPGLAFPEVTRGGEQLTAIANMTQRFIRDSVAGRPLAMEVEALAKEIAQPGMFVGDERSLIKLETMRNQLLEIQDIATSMLDRPQGFDQKTVIGARQDLVQLAPLLENYKALIDAYEIGTGKRDKPDPAMFERGLGNAQGSALMQRFPPAGFEDKNMTFVGRDTGVPRSALLANQGGPINRRRS